MSLLAHFHCFRIQFHHFIDLIFLFLFLIFVYFCLVSRVCIAFAVFLSVINIRGTFHLLSVESSSSSSSSTLSLCRSFLTPFTSRSSHFHSWRSFGAPYRHLCTPRHLLQDCFPFFSQPSLSSHSQLVHMVTEGNFHHNLVLYIFTFIFSPLLMSFSASRHLPTKLSLLSISSSAVSFNILLSCRSLSSLSAHLHCHRRSLWPHLVTFTQNSRHHHLPESLPHILGYF